MIGSLEDPEDYKAFEAAVVADYDAETTVARELVLRLASLLWRLRRANAIEADLFEIQAEGSAPPQVEIGSPTQKREASVDHAFQSPLGDENREWQQSNDHLAEQYKKYVRGLTHSFLRLAKMEAEHLNGSIGTKWLFGAKLDKHCSRYIRGDIVNTSIKCATPGENRRHRIVPDETHRNAR